MVVMRVSTIFVEVVIEAKYQFSTLTLISVKHQSPPPKILLPRTTLAWITSLHDNLSFPSSNNVLYDDQNKGGDLVIRSQAHSKIPNHQKVFQKSTEYHEILPTSLTIIIQSKVTKPCLTYLM